MSVRNPFIVPFEKRDEVDEIKRRFCPYQSDHLTLLAAYNGWRATKSRGKNEERNFCAKNFLSQQTLMMIFEMKKQLAVLLAEIGFLHRKHNADMMSVNDPVNQHAGNIRLIEAVIVAGLYPHIARLETTVAAASSSSNNGSKSDRGNNNKNNNDRPRWVTREGDVSIHPSSVLFNEDVGFDSPYLVFHEKIMTTKVYIRDATVVGSYALLLFGVDMDCQHDRSLVILDDWLSFKIKPRTAALLSDLRLELRKILVEKIQCPSVDLGGSSSSASSSSTSSDPSLLLLDDSEGSESRSEFRKILSPATMLSPSSSADPSSTSSSTATPLTSAPDLISVVALLLAEEDKQRRTLRENASTAAAATAPPGGVIVAVRAANASSTSSTSSTPSMTSMSQQPQTPMPQAMPPQPQQQSQQRQQQSQSQQSQPQSRDARPNREDRPRSARPPKQQSNGQQNGPARAAQTRQPPQAASSKSAPREQQWEEST